MSKRSSLFTLFSLLTLLISSLACSSLAKFTEETSISIVNPIPELRIGDESPRDGSPIQTNLSVRMNTNSDRFISAIIYLNGVARSEPCLLAPNDITNCGALDLYNQGQQTVRVEATKLNGEIISAETVFLWQPYIGWDALALKLARVAGSNSPTLGFYLFGTLFILIFASIIGIKSRTGQGAVLGIVISVVILIIMFLAVSPTVAANIVAAIIGLISTSLVFGVIIYGMSRNYEIARKNSVYLSLPGPNGQITVDLKSGALLGNSTSDLQAAAIVQAYLVASQATGIAPHEGGVRHYIDGSLVSEKEFNHKSRRKNTQPSKNILMWLFTSKKAREQKLLK